MRIAVCRPQVPFERGGAEIFADDLVGELRARDHEADLVTVPFKWYPGERVLTQAFLWRLLDLDGGGRPADRPRDRHEVPVVRVRHPNKVVWLLHQFRQAYELDRTELGQFGERAEERATRERCSGSTGSRSARRGRCSPPRATSPSGSSARPGSRPRCCRTRRRSSPYRMDGVRRTSSSRSAGSTGRSGSTCCSRRRGRDASLPVVDRRRRPRPRAARGARAPARPRRAGRASPAASTRSELADLYARCLAVYYAPVDEDFGMVPVRGVPLREAGRDDAPTPAGRSRSSPTGGRGSSASPSAAALARGVLVAPRRTATRRGAGAGGQGARRAGHVGRRSSAAAR